MGNTFEVTYWGKSDFSNGYSDRQLWQGESFIAAIFNLIKAKRAGHACVSLKWR